jgi:hypothetical protein
MSYKTAWAIPSRLALLAQLTGDVAHSFRILTKNLHVAQWAIYREIDHLNYSVHEICSTSSSICWVDHLLSEPAIANAEQGAFHL